MAERWREELADVVSLMRDLSRETDPQVAARVYSDRVRKGLVPADEFLGLSRRDLQHPRVRVTRFTGWKEQPNPWKDAARLMLGEKAVHGGHCDTISGFRISRPTSPNRLE